MSVKIKVTVSEEAKKIVQDLQTLPPRMLERVAKAMDNENNATVSHIVTDYLSFPRQGPPVAIGCRAQSGLLRQTIRASAARISGQSVVSAIGSNLKYAAAQEFGADLPARTIYPKPGNKALRFKIGDRVIFAKKVNIPASRLPARGFVQRGIGDRTAQYSSAVTDAILKAWNEK